MRNVVRMKIKAGVAELQRAMLEIEGTLHEALLTAANVLKFKVMDLTPRWKGGLVQGIRTEAKSREARVYGEGVVMKVMENRPHATWSTVPPHQPIKDWVEGKLGISGDQSDRVAWAIQMKIKRQGLTIPNLEGRGEMFSRAYKIAQSTNLHWEAFMAKMRQLERRAV